MVAPLAALATAGDRPAALAALADAVSSGAQQGYHRAFLDHTEPVPSLLAELDAATGSGVLSSEHRAHLRGLVEQITGPTTRSPEAALVVALTERELEVLQLLADGKQNKQIAADLYVSNNTIKKHIAHIFDKLTVTNRTAAVTRARELELLT